VTPADARAELLAVPRCGPRVVERLESIGVTCLRDLRHEDPYDLMVRVNLAAGRPIWHPPMAIRALENLVDAANATPGPGS
jgi:hypothetical protein